MWHVSSAPAASKTEHGCGQYGGRVRKKEHKRDENEHCALYNEGSEMTEQWKIKQEKEPLPSQQSFLK